MTGVLPLGWSALRRQGAALTLVLLPVAVAAQEATPEVVTPEEPPLLACMVNGYDLALTNNGTETLPIGTEIAWEVPFARREGVYALTRAMDPKAITVVTATNGSSYLNPRIPCTAELVEAAEAAAP